MTLTKNTVSRKGAIVALFCAAFASLAGCSASSSELLGFVAFNALYQSAIGYVPLRSAIGTLFRDAFVSIF